jgi:hypothetical protein
MRIKTSELLKSKYYKCRSLDYANEMSGKKSKRDEIPFTKF